MMIMHHLRSKLSICLHSNIVTSFFFFFKKKTCTNREQVFFYVFDDQKSQKSHTTVLNRFSTWYLKFLKIYVNLLIEIVQIKELVRTGNWVTKCILLSLLSFFTFTYITFINQWIKLLIFCLFKATIILYNILLYNMISYNL